MSGGPEVKDHKWVIHEELKDAGKEPLEPGTQAVVNADHMEGMKEPPPLSIPPNKRRSIWWTSRRQPAKKSRIISG